MTKVLNVSENSQEAFCEWWKKSMKLEKGFQKIWMNVKWEIANLLLDHCFKASEKHFGTEVRLVAGNGFILIHWKEENCDYPLMKVVLPHEDQIVSGERLHAMSSWSISVLYTMNFWIPKRLLIQNTNVNEWIFWTNPWLKNNRNGPEKRRGAFVSRKCIVTRIKNCETKSWKCLNGTLLSTGRFYIAWKNLSMHLSRQWGTSLQSSTTAVLKRMDKG